MRSLTFLAFGTLALLVANGLASCGSSGNGGSGGGGSSGGSGGSGGGSGGSGGGSGGSGGAGGGASEAGPGGYPAAHPEFPQVVYQGGPTLTAPQIISVTFPGDTLASQLTLFAQQLESSSWWSTVTAQYCAGGCIGEGTPAMAIALTTAPATSYTDSETGGPSTLRDWLASSISSGALPGPQAGAVSSSIYVLYFPTTTTLTLDSLTSCVDFDGYHGSVTVGSQEVPYAVVPECSGPQAGNTPPITTLQNTTITASHEIVETTTDPSALSQAYYLNLSYDPNRAWVDIQGGGEVADLCIDPFLLDQDEWDEGGFTVQRIWSNTQAAAGGDPCSPIAPGAIYYNAAPEVSYFVLDVGSSITFDVTAFSTAARADWSMSVQDWSTPMGSSTVYLTFDVAGAVDHGAGPILEVNNGTTARVTMTLENDPGSLSAHEADGSIVSFSGTPDKPTSAHFWPFAVLSPADAENDGLDATVTTGTDAPHRVRHAGALGRRARPTPNQARVTRQDLP